MTGILRDVVIAREARALARPFSPAVAPAESVTVPSARDFDAGYEDGREQGFAQGLREGQVRGRDEGFAAGHEEGQRAAQRDLERIRAAADESLRERAQRIEKLLDGMEGALRERLSAAGDEMLALCFEVLVSAFGEFAVRSEGVHALVQRALAQSHLAGPTTVHLHPLDLALIEADLPSRAAGASAADTLQFVADETVALGGCVLSTPHGGLDARIETQLARVAEVFRRARDEEHRP